LGFEAILITIVAGMDFGSGGHFCRGKKQTAMTRIQVTAIMIGSIFIRNGSPLYTTMDKTVTARS
jgi:predicted membrane GTPase involved in stress response